jgi:UDP-galactopyranose mutase
MKKYDYLIVGAGLFGATFAKYLNLKKDSQIEYIFWNFRF